jgi:hypothetical protein
MPELEDLIAVLEEEDPDTAQKLRERLDQVDELSRMLKLKERDLKLATDKTLKEKYPRAMLALEKGRLRLPDDPSDEALLAVLKDKEEELADFGVVPPGEEKKVSPVQETAQGSDAYDPASAFGEPVAGSPRTPERDIIREYKEAMALNTREGRIRASQLLAEMNQMGFQRPEGPLWQLAEDAEEDEFNKPIRAKW